MLRLFGRGLDCIRGFRTVFHNVNFELEMGRALALTGPNGSGKSTLLRLIAGLLRPSGGEIRLEGGNDDQSIAAQAHYLGHLDAFKPALTVEENLGFGSGYLGKDLDLGRDLDLGKALGRTAPAEPGLRSVGLEGLGRLPAAYLSAG